MKSIPRRTVLRGLLGGAAISLPLPRLAGMLNGNGTAYADGRPLRPRYLTWFFGNGAYPEHWIPSEIGVDDAWMPSPALASLAEFKPWLTVLSGHNVPVQGVGAVHKWVAAAMLTGATAGGGANVGDVLLPSLDQLIAPVNNADTAFPRGVHVGISNVTGAGALDFNVSFNGPNAPNPPIYSPTALFTSLLALSGTLDPDPSLLRRKKILDAVREDAKELRVRLGSADKQRIDLHLEGLDQLQAQINASLEGADCGVPVDPDVAYPDRGEDGVITRARCQAFADLIAYAFSCELTRVATHVFSCSACHAPYEEAGLGPGTFHEDYGHLSHPMGEEYARQGFNTGVEYTMGCFAELLKRFRDTPDGADSNLLDNSAIYVTSCVGHPEYHSRRNAPALIVGKAGGAFRGNIHHAMGDENASKIPFTVVRAFDPGATSFGADEGLVTEAIPEILA